MERFGRHFVPVDILRKTVDIGSVNLPHVFRSKAMRKDNLAKSAASVSCTSITVSPASV
jgi:hypothetical protein